MRVASISREKRMGSRQRALGALIACLRTLTGDYEEGGGATSKENREGRALPPARRWTCGDWRAVISPVMSPGGWVGQSAACWQLPWPSCVSRRKARPRRRMRRTTRPSARPWRPSCIADVFLVTEPVRRRARAQDGADGQPGFVGMGGEGGRLNGTAAVGGRAVGGQARELPLGLARRVPKGDLVPRSHFHPSGKAEREQTCCRSTRSRSRSAVTHTTCARTCTCGRRRPTARAPRSSGSTTGTSTGRTATSTRRRWRCRRRQ